MEELSISYFRNLLSSNSDDLKNMCTTWSKISSDESNMPEEVSDEIRTTIGLTNLLLDQKLKQFKGLIDDSENKTGEKEITCVDLQGFWDMVYFEVEKIQKQFTKLEMCQKNDWTFVEEIVKQADQKKKPITVQQAAKLVVPLKSAGVAARQRLAEHKLKMRAQLMKQKSDAARIENDEQKDTESEENGIAEVEDSEQKTAPMEIPVEAEKPEQKRAGRQKNVKKQKSAAAKIENDKAEQEEKVTEAEESAKAEDYKPVQEQETEQAEMEKADDTEAEKEPKGKNVKRGKQKNVKKQKSAAAKSEKDKAEQEPEVTETEINAKAEEDKPIQEEEIEPAEMEIAEDTEATKSKGKSVKRTAKQKNAKKQKSVPSTTQNKEKIADHKDSESVAIVEEDSAKAEGQSPMKKQKTEATKIESELVEVIQKKNVRTRPVRNATNEKKEPISELKDSESTEIAEDKSAKATSKTKPTLKNIENLHSVEESKPETRPVAKATSKRKKEIKETEQKENIVKSTEKTHAAVSKRTRKIPDDFMPLQCTTRSAARKAAQAK